MKSKYQMKRNLGISLFQVTIVLKLIISLSGRLKLKFQVNLKYLLAK